MKHGIGLGSIVTINDGSYAVRVDEFETTTCIGLSRGEFEVVAFLSNALVGKYSDSSRHDVFIKHTKTGAVYLHSLDFLNCVEVPASSWMVQDLSDLCPGQDVYDIVRGSGVCSHISCLGIFCKLHGHIGTMHYSFIGKACSTDLNQTLFKGTCHPSKN